MVERWMQGLQRPLAEGTTEEYDYDLYDDKTVSDLQTTINEAKTYRNRSMPLRPTCLAGIAPGAGELFGSALLLQAHRKTPEASRFDPAPGALLASVTAPLRDTRPIPGMVGGHILDYCSNFQHRYSLSGMVHVYRDRHTAEGSSTPGSSTPCKPRHACQNAAQSPGDGYADIWSRSAR